MALTEGMGTSYIDSICVLLSALFVACRSRAALIFVLLLINMITITISKAEMLTTENVVRELIDAMYAVLTCVLMLIGLLKLPVIFPQTTVCMEKLHSLLSVGTSVQVTLVWLVVVGQLPQFDARML
jgi:hypothetical protein